MQATSIHNMLTCVCACGCGCVRVRLFQRDDVIITPPTPSQQAVRQGLKKFSDWPTYPQLYIAGELIGGLDIIKEMVESDTLKDVMPKEESLNDRLKASDTSAPPPPLIHFTILFYFFWFARED